MAFWGIEVRPGKPYTHRYDDTRGRLRVCQATLGSGKGTTRSVVQCNVGNNSPILICSLIPDSSETCHLELEFEEEDEVVFSVIGQRSVHLSGYYTGSGRINDGDDEDSYGEDIAETDSDDSISFDVDGSEDDEYESDFIDDGDDIEMCPASAPRKSGVVIEEIVEDGKPSNGNGTHRRLRKKHQVSDTEDGDDDSQRQRVVKPAAPAAVESEDEDGFPLSFSASKMNTGRNVGTVKELSEKTDDEDRKRKIDAISQDSESERDKLLPSDSNTPLVDAENTGKKKKKIKDRRPLETGSNMDGKEDIAVGGEKVVSANGVKSIKKKKEKTEKGKASETGSESLAEGTDTEAKGDAKEAGNTDPINEDNFAEAEKLPYNKDEKSSQKSKKKKRKLVKEDISQEQGGSPAETADERNQLANGEKTNRVTDSSTNGTPQESKKKKTTKSKNHDKDLSNTQEPANQVEAEEKKQPLKARTFSNGLIIEELSMGKPDGKRASPGNKVSVYYVGKLQNGKIFDSNTGHRPFQFRLGIGHVIKGWDVGINGMRVGDKRRLTIPPAMGYGDRNIGKIPKNSWLVFDVELVDVKQIRSK
ncbi:peptidyl-prolyl cis-trans isomerase FKBP53 [Ananas comosus]|uniref:peptidylprolyl isomerase n=1 Tax=Ananas comosus TaxID=4615 RepID=A0A6P5GXQ8_ANACO|nr:peptidyl-prolyl cis-trans isomerase FKBP53 [Ananas comosus]